MADCTVFDFVVHGIEERIFFEGDYVVHSRLQCGDRIHAVRRKRTFSIMVGATSVDNGIPCRIMSIVRAQIQFPGKDQVTREANIVHLALEENSTALH